MADSLPEGGGDLVGFAAREFSGAVSGDVFLDQRHVPRSISRFVSVHAPDGSPTFDRSPRALIHFNRLNFLDYILERRLCMIDLMKGLLPSVFLALLLQSALPAAEPGLPPAKSPPRIIIKVDDLRTGNSPRVSAQWQRLAAFVKEKRIKVNIGIICDSLEGNKPEYFQWIKDLHSTGLVTFWLHAYDHKPWTAADGTQHNEFAGRSAGEQLQRLVACQQLAREKLGFVFDTFGPPGTGAPGPGTDAATHQAMQDEPNMKVWLYPSPIDELGKNTQAQGKVTILDRVWKVNIEQPLFKPSLAAFQKGFAEFAGQRDYFVIQGHPQTWTDEGFAEFVKIVEFAGAQGCAFVSPLECAAALVPPTTVSQVKAR